MTCFTNIASSMNLSLPYKDKKPKGHWDNIENMKQEVRKPNIDLCFCAMVPLLALLSQLPFTSMRAQ